MKKSSKNKIYKISKKEAKAISLKTIKEDNALWKKHCSKIKDPLSLLLKCHLLAENTLEDLLVMRLKNPKELLKRSSFSQKLLLLESLDTMPSNIYKKLKALNDLRNHYAHCLDYKLSSKKEIKIATELSINPKKLEYQDVANMSLYILGYLSAVKNIIKLFPFLTHSTTNSSLFMHDPCYLTCLPIILKANPEFGKIMDKLKI